MAIWALDTLPRRSEVLTTCKGFQSLGWSIPLRIHCSFVGMNPTNPWLLAISSAVAVFIADYASFNINLVEVDLVLC